MIGKGMTMKASTPTLTEYKTLYDLAKQFKALAPWKWMYDHDMFGVQNPETGETGWCCVLGNLGEIFALVVYRGTEGIDGYLKIMSGEVDIYDPDVPQHQKCLMASFGDREDLEPEDLAIIKRLGLKFRGRKTWPSFRNYEPGFVPWFITSDEAKFLAVTIEQAIDIAVRFDKNERLLYPDQGDTYLVRIPEKTGKTLSWRDEYMKLLPPPPPPPMNDRIDEIRVQRIKMQAERTDAAWEVGYCYAPMPIQERRDQRPYYSKMLAVLDQATGLVVTAHTIEGTDEAAEFRDHLLGLFERIGYIPAQIILNRDNVQQILAPITAQLGISVCRVKKLNCFNEFYFSMLDHMRR